MNFFYSALILSDMAQNGPTSKSSDEKHHISHLKLTICCSTNSSRDTIFIFVAHSCSD